MIARIWHGIVPAGKSQAYREFRLARAVPDYRSTPGNLGVQLPERPDGDVVHFVTLTYWLDLPAIRAFAGADETIARYYPEDRGFLLEFEDRARHTTRSSEGHTEASERLKSSNFRVAKRGMVVYTPRHPNLEVHMTQDMQAELSQLSAEYGVVERAIAFLDQEAVAQPELADVARAVGLSEFHFQRTFTHWAGISPKRFLQFLTRERARELLERSENLLDATYQLGLSSAGRLHDLFIATEAVTPGEYRSRGEGITIRYGIFPTPFGDCLLGVTERGICHLGFVQGSEGDALDEMVEFWRQARIVEDRSSTAPLVERVFRLAQSPTVPLHVLLKGTNFQIKVWEALLRIPSGSVSTYEEIAQRIGHPRAVRAVGSAVARNPIPVLIPCHRVIRKLGEFGNYRYGTVRKRALIAWESARVDQLVTTA